MLFFDSWSFPMNEVDMRDMKKDPRIQVGDRVQRRVFREMDLGSCRERGVVSRIRDGLVWVDMEVLHYRWLSRVICHEYEVEFVSRDKCDDNYAEVGKRVRIRGDGLYGQQEGVIKSSGSIDLEHSLEVNLDSGITIFVFADDVRVLPDKQSGK